MSYKERHISIAAEVTPPKKRRVASKAPGIQQPKPLEKPADATVEGHPAQEPGSGQPNTPQPATIPYSWDRTQDEARMKMAPFPPVPGNLKKLPIGAFCDYWNAIPVALHTHATIYVQRWLPVMKPTVRVDDWGKRHTEHQNCLKLYREHEPITEEMLISKLGYGDYTFRLNDTRISIKASPNAATIVYSELKTKRDWAEHPPVLDPKDLEMDDPANTGYITWARSRGLIPNETQQESNDMQNAQAGVTERLTSTVERLTDKVIQQSEKPAPVPPAPVPPPPANNDGGALKAVADLAIAVLNRPQQQNGGLEILDGAVKILAAIAPKADTSSADLAKEVVKSKQSSDERMFQLQKEQLDNVRAELKEARTPPPAVAAVAPVAPVTEVDVLERMVRQQELIKKLKGGSSHSEEENSKPGTLEKYADLLPHIAPVAGQIIGQFFQTIQAGLQSWQLISYNNALVRNGVTPQAPTMTTQKPPEGQPIPPQQPAPTPEQQAQQNHITNMLRALDQAADPIGTAFGDGDSGDSFAEMVIKFKKRPTYDLIRSLGQTGPDTFDVNQFLNSVRTLLMHPQRTPAIAKLAEEVLGKPTFKTFLEEFFNYDAILAAQTQENER